MQSAPIAMPQPTIIALGGGGFSTEPDNPLLEDYILAKSASPQPRVCFLPTASGDADPYIVKFYNAFSGNVFPNRRAVPTHLSLFRRSIADLRDFVLSQDILYVGGGNTANMLAVWRVHGLDSILREAWSRGIILCGPSAGAVCWFESGVTDSFGLPLRPIANCLGFLAGSFCPHYDSESTRRPIYQHLVATGELPPGHAADDSVALHYTGADLTAIVSSRPTARAWRVALQNGQLHEAEIVPTYRGPIA
jgi:dipeptidase E